MENRSSKMIMIPDMKGIQHMIGTFSIDLTDNSRIEVLGKKGGYRKITIRFYYPGIEDRSARRTDCLTDINRKWLGRKQDFALYNRRISLYENLPVKEGSFPLIIFNHGYSGFMEQNNDLCQYLAEHGYIIASVGHSFEAGEIVYEDGTSALFDKSLYFKMFKPLIPAVIDLARLRKKKLTDEEGVRCFGIHQNRYEAFVADRVKEWLSDDRLALKKIHEMNEDPDSLLYQKICFDNGTGITGHSYGGAVAYAHCLYDDEFSCGVNIDGGLFGNYGTMINHKPFMQILNPGNVNVVSRSRIFHDAPVHYMIFKDMEHNGFTDKKLVSKQKSETGTLDPELALNTLNEAHLTFFDRYLKAHESGNASRLELNPEAVQKYEVLQ